MTQAPIEVALAILKQDRRCLLQLRDDIPNIAYPGQWGLFGGHLDPGETPANAVKRELLEEIGFAPPSFVFLASLPTPKVVRHIFAASLTVDLDHLVLQEGQDMALWTLEQIEEGARYSSQAGETRPLAPPHQGILLEYLRDGPV